MKKNKKPSKEVSIVNFYGILSFIGMILFTVILISSKYLDESTIFYGVLSGFALLGFVISVIFAIYSLCATLEINEYGAILSIISLMIISGIFIGEYYYGRVLEKNNNNVIDEALKCSKATNCSEYKDGKYTCKTDNDEEITCSAKWIDYFREN